MKRRPHTLRGRLGSAGLVVFLTASWAAPGAAQSIDPFYQSLYEDASRAATAGRHGAAAKDYRLACFGMLEAPVRLGDCLARLAVSQAESGQREAFVETLRRLVEVEQRFQGYSRSTVPAAVRLQLESHLERSAPMDALTGVPAFREVAVRRRAAEIRGMPDDEKGRALQLEISQDPTNVTWHVLRGDLLLDTGNATEALEVADRAASSDPGDPGAVCLRGRARATLGACGPRTVEDLARCAAADAPTARQARLLRLTCHHNAAAHQALIDAYDALPLDEQTLRPYRDWARQARRALREGAGEPGEVDGEAPGAVGEGAANAPGALELEVVEGGWKVLRSDSRDRFDASYESVRVLADRYPDWAEAQHLAAELAYRLSLWADSVKYFQRADRIVSAKPDLQFYLAVALYKSGDATAASAILDQCLPKIQTSDFVNFWVERIRAAAP